MSESTGVRQRTTGDKKTTSSESTGKQNIETEPPRTVLGYVSDGLRMLGGLVLLLGLVSYFVTGSSVAFGYRPWWSRPDQLKAYFHGPLFLTDSELARYDGTDASIPLLLAVNGTIFDVSASRYIYGPGGSYHYFAGKDATRAYVTGCFATDLTPDIRGVERMFMPVDSDDDTEEEAQLSSRDRKLRREREMRKAKESVRRTIDGWVQFYRSGKKPYFEVGKIVGRPEFEGEPPKLCEQAEKGRTKRGEEQSGRNKRGGRPANVGPGQ